MYIARFLYTTYEEKYAIRDWDMEADGWYLSPKYFSAHVAYESKEALLYNKVKERNLVLHEEKTSIYFEAGDNVRLKDEVVKVTKVIKTLDGAIEYYTDKEVYTSLNTRETFFDERQATT